MSLTTIVLAIAILWLIVLSVLFYYQYRVYKALTTGVSEGDIVALLKKLLDKHITNEKGLADLSKQVAQNFEEGRSHVRKVGLVRFNPFGDMGGDHSFSLCLLNDKDTGFVLTSLHTRERTRTYLKEITKGKCNQDLSKEEDKAIKIAQKK